MDFDTILGIIILTTALSLISYLTFWSKRTIERIEKKHLDSTRQILKELKDG